MHQTKPDDLNSIRDILINSRLFSKLPVELIDSIIVNSEHKQLVSNTKVIEEGKLNDSLYILLEGRLVLTQADKPILKLKRKGDLVGEMSIIGHKPSSLTARTIGLTRLLKVSDFGYVDELDFQQNLQKNFLFNIFNIILADKLQLAVQRAKEYEVTRFELEQERELLQTAYQSSLSEIHNRLRAENELEQLKKNLDLLVKRETAKLKEAMEDAEKENQSKSDFLAVVSHEIRTPIQAILGYSRLAVSKHNKMTKDQTLQYFRNIESSGHTLLNLINDLLDLSKLEAIKSNFDFKSTKISKLCELVLGEFESLLEEKQQIIRIRPRGDEPYVSADENKIILVIRNLLSNATKFADVGGEIEIEIAGQNDALVTKIIDNGMGIPPEELEYVFEKYVQSCANEKKNVGTGLGLAICKSIIESHNGRIWAENNPTGGACISFTLPYPP